MKSLRVFEAIALLVGTVVGAGFLGIPYVVSKVGFPLGLILIVTIGLLVLLQLLVTAEVVLRTRSKHQIAGYVATYLGPHWKRAVYILVILETYGALLAYVIGEGQVLAALFGGYPLRYSVGFLVLGAALVFFDLKLIEKVELALTGIMLAVVIAITFFSWSHVRFENLFQGSPHDILPAYGVILFAFLGAAAVPEMRLALRGQERFLPTAVITAMVVPIVVYSVFTVAVLGVTGGETSPVATVGLGQRLGPMAAVIGNLLAVITMLTAFLGQALALKETFWFDLKFQKNEAWFLTVVVPFIFILFGFQNFIGTLLVVGAVFGGLQGIITVLTWWRAIKRGDRKPEFHLSYQQTIGWLLVGVFGIGLVYMLAGG